MQDLNGRSRPRYFTRDLGWLDSYPIPPPPKPPGPTNYSKISWVWRDWLEYSTFHGVLDVSRPGYGNCWKLCWMFIMVAFAGAAVYSIKEVITEYVTNPTIQNYREEAIASFELPDIVLCTHHRFNFSVLEAMGASPAVIQDLISRFDGTDTTALLQEGPQTGSGSDSETARQAYDEFRRQNQGIGYEQILRLASIRCESIVKGCSWGQPCCRIATPFVHMQYGQCYRFSTGSSTYQQTYPGPTSGLQLALQAGTSDYGQGTSGAIRGVLMEFLYQNEFMSFSYSQIPAGVLATVHLYLQVRTFYSP